MLEPSNRQFIPRQLIVTADDFGLSPGADRGIIEAYRRGIVRSTALLVNFPEVAESVDRLCQEPCLEVGIHLNLTAGPPVLPPERVPSLVGNDGNFHSFTRFFTRVALSQISWREVREEWRAQFERGIRLGCRFTFITSHQHVHMLAQAAEIAAELTHEFEVGGVRLTNYRLSQMVWPSRLKGLALSPFVSPARRILEQRGVFHNESTIDVPAGSPDSSLHQLCRTIERLDTGVHELICHPAEVDSLLKTRDSYRAGRLNELLTLTHPRILEFFETGAIGWTTFNEQSSTPREGHRFRERESGWPSIPAILP